MITSFFSPENALWFSIVKLTLLCGFLASPRDTWRHPVAPQSQGHKHRRRRTNEALGCTQREELNSRFVLLPRGGDEMGSNTLSPGMALLMAKTGDLKVQSKTKLESSERGQVSQTRIAMRERGWLRIIYFFFSWCLCESKSGVCVCPCVRVCARARPHPGRQHICLCFGVLHHGS